MYMMYISEGIYEVPSYLTYEVPSEGTLKFMRPPIEAEIWFKQPPIEVF